MLSRLGSDPGVTIGLALLAGILVQVIAQRLRLPSIILLLAAGILLGPDVGDLIRPENLGEWLHVIVSFGVSIILFEGAMLLDVKQLRRQARGIRQLSTIAVAVTALGGGLGAYYILGWDLPAAVLFGTLVTVTGPTVITPLVRRMRLQSRIATVMQAEGIFVDAIGAIVAVVALEFILFGEDRSVAVGLLEAGARLAVGTIFGVIAGLLMAWLLREGSVIPENQQRVFVLAFVLALYQISNAATSESGILAVVVAGLVVGNISRSGELVELREFKEQLTVLMLGLLFVLLAADVRIEEVQSLGWAGVGLVAFLMLVVRPLNVLVGTAKTDMTWKERLFLAWMAPRGIVAAAVASLFAQTMQEERIEGGPELRAMVFTVIAVTVVMAGATGGLLARVLGLRRGSSSGYVILGAQSIGRTLARVLKKAGEDVVLIDSNPQLCLAAEAEGLRILYGSGLADAVQQRAELDVRNGAIGVTTNDEVNLLFARRAKKMHHVPRTWVAIRSGRLNVTVKTVRTLGSRLLFGAPVNLDRWNQRIDRTQASLEAWSFAGPGKLTLPEGELSDFLPLAVQRGNATFPFDDEAVLRKGDVVHLLMATDRVAAAEAALRQAGLERAVRKEEAEVLTPVTQS